MMPPAKASAGAEQTDCPSKDPGYFNPSNFTAGLNFKLQLLCSTVYLVFKLVIVYLSLLQNTSSVWLHYVPVVLHAIACCVHTFFRMPLQSSTPQAMTYLRSVPHIC